MTEYWRPNAGDSLLLFEAVSDAIFVTDRQGCVVSLNPMAQTLVGQGVNVVGRVLHQILGCQNPEASPMWSSCPIEHAVASGTVAQLSAHEFVHGRGDGRTALTMTCWPRYEGQRCTGCLVICRDLTLQREAERELRRIATLAEQAPNPIIEMDPLGQIQYANAAMIALLTELGFTSEDSAAVLPANLVSLLTTCLKERHALEQIDVPVGNRHFAWSFFPLPDVGLVRAYGEEVTAAVQLRRDKEAAEEAARAKSVFLGTMGHEIRTPMNGILGLTQLLRETKMADEQRRYIDTVHLCTESLVTLVNDLLDFAKIEAGKMTLEVVEIDIHSLINEVVTVLSETARKKSLDVQIHIAPEVPPALKGDPVRLRQILFNLIGNALKFTERGSIELFVWRERLHRDDAEGVLLQWEITDTGIGMTQEQQAKLFQPYVQGDRATTRRFGGTGLGLSITKQLVELMHGKISIASAPQTGTTVYFTTALLLSNACKPANVSSVSEHVVAPAPRLATRVLVAEDNEINQMVACKFLQKLGYKVEVVRTGREAVDALSQSTYDVILMDCQMPEMDGFEATRQIRLMEADRQIRRPIIIALTGNVGLEDEQRCQESGMDDYLAKPVTMDALRLKLAQCGGK